jgi:hypothetical protein
VNHGEGPIAAGWGIIKGLEGFWEYLKWKLTLKRGIRRDKSPLYLGEYVWRNNYRADPKRVKGRRIFQLLEKSLGQEWDFTSRLLNSYGFNNNSCLHIACQYIKVLNKSID